MAAYNAKHAFQPSVTASSMPRSHRVLTSTITAAAIAASLMTMVITGNAAPSGADVASTSHVVHSTPAQPAHPTHDGFASDTALAASNLPASTPSAATGSPAPAGIRVAAGNAVTRSTQGAALDVSPLAADGIPVTALHAYQDAAAALAGSDPGCGIPWPLLAGIGRVESDHGRFGNATLFTNGTSSARILGPVLDGHGTAVIRDTDGGLLDGNTAYDRAMGPMQFIPGTWAGYASDGNGDGVRDPFNIYDASLAAAKYLCAAGGDLATTAGQVRAVFAYNHLVSYLNTVLALEHAYASGAGVIVPDPPATSSIQPTPAPQPPAAKPVTTKPVTKKPVTIEPVIAKPVTAKPAKPVTKPPVAPVSPAPAPASGAPTTPTLTCPPGTQPIPPAQPAGTAGSVPGPPVPNPATPVTTAATATTTAGTTATTDTQLMPDGSLVPVGCMLVPVPVPLPVGAATSTG